MNTIPLFHHNAIKNLTRTVKQHPAQTVIITLSILIIAWLGFNTHNFYSHQRAYTDAGVFQTVAQHMAAGKTLYAEIWDHKPPIIYFINLIPIYFGDASLQTVRTMQTYFDLLGIFAFYFISLLLSKRPLFALLTTIGFHYFFFVPEMYQGGNLTEEYATVFVLFGILFLLTKQLLPESFTNYFCLLAGIFFTLAAFTKEPFAASAIPWLLYLGLEPKQSWRQRGISLLFFIAGCISITILITSYFLINGNLENWLQVIAYNRAYVEYSQTIASVNQEPFLITAYQRFVQYYLPQGWVWISVFLVGCVSIFYLPHTKKLRMLPLIFLLQFILEQFASNLSRFSIGHYYLQYTASFCLLCLCGLCFLTHLFSKYKYTEYALAALFVVILVTVDQKPLSLYRLRMNTPYRPAEIGILSKTLNEIKKEDDTLWTNLGTYSKYYAETNMQSPCPYIYTYEHLFIDSGGTTAQQKRDALTACLQENPPAYMILSDQAFEDLQKVKLIALSEWIKQNYTPNYDVTENGTIIYTYTQSAQ